MTESSSKPFKPSFWRRPGFGNLLVGILFLGLGIGVTLYSEKVFWWGAMVFGGIEICIGGYKLLRGA